MSSSSTNHIIIPAKRIRVRDPKLLGAEGKDINNNNNMNNNNNNIINNNNHHDISHTNSIIIILIMIQIMKFLQLLKIISIKQNIHKNAILKSHDFELSKS